MAMSFRAKVLAPVVAVMILLTGILMWLDNRRTVAQLQADTAAQLETAEAVFNTWQQSRTDELLSRYQVVANDPGFRGAAGQTNFKTFRDFLERLIDRKFVNVDIIVVTTAQGQQFPAVTHDPHIDTGAFERNCADSISQALGGQPTVDTVRNGSFLLDVVSIPIHIRDNPASDDIVGAVSFGVQNSIAEEFNRLTHSRLILIANGRIVSSTGLNPDSRPELVARFDQLSTAPAGRARNLNEITLDDEHFLCVAGKLVKDNREHNLGYLILSSYEKQLQLWKATQRMILFASSLAILLGAGVIWFLVRRVTQPLSELRRSAEAVGRGDFSRRVEVNSEDECGELARVFNQMTENLKGSREQLEMTVETLKTTQAQLIQSEKLSGLGEFIAGVAHELNNPLTSVMGFSELLRQADKDPKHKRYLELIHKSALRCQKIVQALLSFARRRSPERKPVCVNTLIEAALEILQYQLRTSNIEVVTKLDPQLPLAMVDPHQIQQVIVNIINNARQAIEAHQPKGLLNVTTETEGDSVRVIIQDNGPGIAEENLSKIFDPFFTTKAVGQGTGLGLSLCYGIIKEHGGTIVPHSKPGEGATFMIELPITREAGDVIEEKHLPSTDKVNPREGVGVKVLVIDDEEPILQMVREALTPRGYEVDTVPDGESGLQKLSKKKYDLTLCDWKMPGLNGQQVYERLLGLNPALSRRIIFITGDVINDHARRFLEEQNKICLPKPFALAEFHAAIRKVLAAR
jgi:signal transduction histidine kinase/CheY-like chemotaxis protein